MDDAWGWLAPGAALKRPITVAVGADQIEAGVEVQAHEAQRWHHSRMLWVKVGLHTELGAKAGYVRIAHRAVKRHVEQRAPGGRGRGLDRAAGTARVLGRLRRGETSGCGRCLLGCHRVTSAFRRFRRQGVIRSISLDARLLRGTLGLDDSEGRRS